MREVIVISEGWCGQKQQKIIVAKLPNATLDEHLALIEDMLGTNEHMKRLGLNLKNLSQEVSPNWSIPRRVRS